MDTTLDENLLNKFEKRRKRIRALQVFKIVFISSLAPVFIVFVTLFVVRLTVYSWFDTNSLLLFSGALIIGLWVFLKITFYAIKKKKVWNDDFKRSVINNQFEHFFDNITYQHHFKIEPESIDDCNLIAKGDSYKGEDYIKGTYKGVDFIRCDLKVLSESRLIFYGQWMVFDFNKRVDGYLRISKKLELLQKKQKHALLPPRAIFFDRFLDPKNQVAKKRRVANLTKVQVEDINFCNNFTIETDNEQTAFYIITPMVIEAINYLNQNVDGNLLIGFYEGKLHVALHSKTSHFESRFNQNIHQQLQNVGNEAQIIHQFIDKLRLDNNYFSLTK